MEYLVSLKELDKRVEQGRLLEIKNPNNECPICKRNRQYLDWWTCKQCSKELSVSEYIEELINYFGNI